MVIFTIVVGTVGLLAVASGEMNGWITVIVSFLTLLNTLLLLYGHKKLTKGNHYQDVIRQLAALLTNQKPAEAAVEAEQVAETIKDSLES